MERPLRSNVRRITTWLGQIIRENEGAAFFNVVETVRRLCKDLRNEGQIGKTGKLKKHLLSLSIPDAHRLARAFTLYFQLVNLVEENHRIQKILSYEKDPARPGPMSIQELIRHLRQKKFTSRQVQAVLDQLHIEPVLTAHPTEAKRKTVIRHLLRIQRLLDLLDRGDLSWRKRRQHEEAILERLEMLWQSKHVRDRRLRVEDEVKYTLNFFQQTIFSASKDFYDALRRALQIYYPDVHFSPRTLTFGSWVGGDRDGNPLVTPETSLFAVKQHRSMVLDYYKNSLNRLFGLLSSAKRFEKVDAALESSVNQELKVFPALRRKAKLAEPGEYYRLKLHAMWRRLDHVKTGMGPSYTGPQDYIDDLLLIQSSLQHHHGHRVASGTIEKLILEAKVFGFHLARLDFRQHSEKIHRAVEDMLGRWPTLAEWPDLVQRPPLKLRVLSSSTRQILNEFRMQKKIQDQFGSATTDHVVLSMTHGEEDLWAFLFLARKAGLLRPAANRKKGWTASVDVVPLFETVADLRHGITVMKRLWANPLYRQILQSRGTSQEVMLGYSDSNKKDGYLSANYELYRAQRDMAEAARKARVHLRFFHGKGGSIDRGGGPAHRAVLAAPDSATRFNLRITEQGEVISYKYSNPVIAQRNFEQMAHSVVMANLFPPGKDISRSDRTRFEAAMQELADLSMEAYRTLIYETPAFKTYYAQATPIDIIQRIQIASRPVFRSDVKDFSGLRAIPWVFSWTQNRHLLSAWYGIGSGIEAYIKKHGKSGLSLLKVMYKRWPFFSSLMENAQLSLAKTDLKIAARYATLVKEDGVRKQIFGQIEHEFDLTVKQILQICGQKRLLQHQPVLLESIQLRNPYIDPLNALQVEYLRLWRSKKITKKKQNEALLVLLMTVNGIAFGMKSTG